MAPPARITPRLFAPSCDQTSRHAEWRADNKKGRETRPFSDHPMRIEYAYFDAVGSGAGLSESELR